MMNVSPAAAAQIRVSIEQDGGDLGLRVTAKRTETGAIEYRLGLDQARDNDQTIDVQDAHIFLSPPDQTLLAGADMDYVELDNGSKRFIFLNPNDPENVAPTRI